LTLDPTSEGKPQTPPPIGSEAARPRRRKRYSGKHPRRFADKYKERQPERYPETAAKVLASGKTPAGSHRSIMVAEILEALAPLPGNRAVDCTLGYGGHARQILTKLLPGGHLLGLDSDPIELPKTEQRLRDLGFGLEVFTARRMQFAGIGKALAEMNWPGADLILADLGVSSMQLDDPSRGFSTKVPGPLDMRMNPQRGQTAAQLILASSASQLADLLRANADEPHAELLATALAGREFGTTAEFAAAIAQAVPVKLPEERQASIRRVFQAVRIAVNEELSSLDALLRQLPACLLPGGRVAILSFHSGEDRRVKKAFAAGWRTGVYSQTTDEVIRPSPEELRANPRSSSAKLRWARRSEQPPG
jgi:16S rRNA (cytosine1402-N4)-methyltransferase